MITRILVEYLLTSHKENFNFELIKSYCSNSNTHIERFSILIQSINFKFSNELKQMLIQEVNCNLDLLGKLSFKLNRLPIITYYYYILF